MDLGLDRVIQVFRTLFPQGLWSRGVTVAGTNGKGTTVAALEWLLTDRGFTVGAYTSPHLHRYNERVQSEWQMVSDRRWCRRLRRWRRRVAV